ncbi:conserved Plasmodium protein, unknown function [Plasmodium berghei]|uniref:WD repeat-containing protein n=2 Tax=Plasmodium berghei TaxID=5821 RepID=A0A509APP9_PLABA|nr:conserved Plasmodium protein, unknown function [Plasmodium berghei ANKA]CXI91929.1 conserved Plasmodium protein, unknown function [Plasmodium berghei]SCL96537.1 conserved Plasmodium protein, unknown function [Plasmodium berghei]SCM16442.1 conserved Plasmodium protein, unknown function [Plasmodium berghei]SCM18236.1 conserved Plasmodium protein, unknown function [Plasmodium berghei]SCN27664.1 conserved Plasmodium protein, unknown function [Plasmodium berghei]|eukprot:XP_034423319.1 conserved Plasmodium protein, unknown function [Plasmodium berghei ANKA]
MKKSKKILSDDESIPDEDNTKENNNFINLYDSDFDKNSKCNLKFKFLKNVKIINDEKKKNLSKICCTKNYLFISTSNVVSQVRIFNYSNLITFKKDEAIISLSEVNNNEEINKDKDDSKSVNNSEEEGSHYDDKTYINLCDIYDKSEFFSDISEPSNDAIQMWNIKNKQINTYNNINKTYGDLMEIKEDAFLIDQDNNNNNKFDENNTLSLSNSEMYKEGNIKNKNYYSNGEVIDLNSHFLEINNEDTMFKEEYLYYDNFLDNSKNENENKPAWNNKGEDEENKTKNIIEENIRNEELQKNGFYISSDLLEINVDVIKTKTNKTPNLIEYVGEFIDIYSPIILMKKNANENILSILTYSGSIYNYDISEEILKELKEKRINKIELYNNIENYFIQQETNKAPDFSLEDDDGKEVTIPPLSICEPYFINSIKCFDFLPDGKTLVCVGFNKDYFLSFVDCYTGKKIIYNKKIKIQKPSNNRSNDNKDAKNDLPNDNMDDNTSMQINLICDFNYIYVEKEKKTFNGEFGNFVYIGSSCGYLVFIFISEHFVKFLNILLRDKNVKSGSLFIYDPNLDYVLENNVFNCIVGNVDDVYKLDKSMLYALLDDDDTNKNIFSLDNNTKENIFKRTENNFFSYAFFISKNVKVNSIISLNTKKNDYINLFIALNNGKVLNYIFDIFTSFSTKTPITMSNLYSYLNKNNSNVSKNCIHNENSDNNVFIKKSEKLIYDFTGLHKSTTINNIDLYQNIMNNNYHIFINSNVKKIRELSDKNFYITYMMDVHTKKIENLYRHISYIIDSCISPQFYFCLDDNNKVAIFYSLYM